MLRIFLAVLTAISLPSLSYGQIAEDESLGPEQLRYYLVQAFAADSPAQRLRLNHIGVEVTPSAAGFLVTAVLEDYPAQDVGISRGDILSTVDDQPYHPVYSFNQSDGNGYSPSNDSYDIQWLRAGESNRAAITPVFENLYDSYRSATLNSALEFNTGNKLIGYVRLWGFSRNSNDLVSFQQMMAQFADCDGLILDLRSAYGLLDHSHLNAFLPPARRQLTIDSPLGSQLALSASEWFDSASYFQNGVTVLIDSHTQGGAEIFAYQLAKLERVISLGDDTLGRIGEYETGGQNATLQYRPGAETLIDGRHFEERGLTAEIKVPYTFNQVSRSDPQFEAAVLALLGSI